LSTEIDLLVGT